MDNKKSDYCLLLVECLLSLDNKIIFKKIKFHFVPDVQDISWVRSRPHRYSHGIVVGCYNIFHEEITQGSSLTFTGKMLFSEISLFKIVVRVVAIISTKCYTRLCYHSHKPAVLCDNEIL